MPKTYSLIPLTFVFIAGLSANAMAREQLDPVPEPPPPVKDYRPPAHRAPAPEVPPEDAAIPEPEIVITTRGEDRYEEYRVGGYLYMIKVTPKKGPPYYLVDQTGNGQFTRSDLMPDFRPPMWIIKKF